MLWIEVCHRTWLVVQKYGIEYFTKKNYVMGVVAYTKAENKKEINAVVMMMQSQPILYGPFRNNKITENSVGSKNY